MSIDKWSDSILVVELQDDPSLSDDLAALQEQLDAGAKVDVVIDFSSVHYLNSSNLARLLRIRKQITGSDRRLVLCGIDTNVWSVFLVTGLDKIFECADNVSTALASVRITAE